jgi:hypothetical protein
MSDETEDSRPGINWIQVIAGALAAVSSAVLLSTLGVAGTVIGAALGSVIASVASAWYGRGLDVSRQQVAAQAAALKRVAAARSRLDDAVSAVSRGEMGAQTGLIRADQELEEAEEALEQATHAAHDEADPEQHAAEADGEAMGAQATDPGADQQAAETDEPAPERSLRDLPWKRIGIVAAVIFLVAMAAITVFELTTGRAVSTYTGGSDQGTGTTLPVRNAPRDDSEQRPEDGRRTPAPERPTSSGSATPTEGSTPTEEPTTEPTVEPTAEPTPTLTPTESTTPAPTVIGEATPTADGSTG